MGMDTLEETCNINPITSLKSPGLKHNFIGVD